MPLKNADSIVKMYFEADRGAVRERYESIYGLKPYEDDTDDSADEQADAESDVSIDDAELSADEAGTANEIPEDADLDARFTEVLSLTGVNDALLQPLRTRWAFRHAEEHGGLHVDK